MDNTYEYDVAFSFAGEDRDYVEKVAIFLKCNNISVFYDNFEEEKLWGKNLTAYLEEIYSNKSKYCVIFISQFYSQKQWTQYESAVAMTRMLENNVKQIEYILPVKFDDTKIPGIIKTIGFVDGRKKSPEELGTLIIKKIRERKNIQSPVITIENYKSFLLETLTTNLPDFWNVTYKESLSKLEIRYSFMKFDYFLNLIFEKNKNVFFINAEYTDIFFDTHIFTPSAKIIFSTKENIITDAQIINIDFFDNQNIEITSIVNVASQIKKQVLRKGEYK